MIDYKSKYLAMKLKYINAKQKAGSHICEDFELEEIKELINQQSDYIGQEILKQFNLLYW
tara:strand:- start:513 stop:692 length:180 start_codon:yes stop_codon:yes gene_type:complete